jgi:DNA-directed RNA polymerase subunit M/transcription elongation factor TFIIS
MAKTNKVKKKTPKQDKEEVIIDSMDPEVAKKLVDYEDIPMPLDTFNPQDLMRDKIESLGFITENSKDVSVKLIKYAQSSINRIETINKFSSIFNSHKTAIELEKGIFEFTLVHVTLNSLDKNNVTAIYKDKVYDIYVNLDQTSYIKNKTLLPSILSGAIKPALVAFLSPHQLHPEQWSDIINKKQFEEETKRNMATTDIYKCRKCGERKCTITELQIRSADEKSTVFVTCLVCYTTFCK